MDQDTSSLATGLSNAIGGYLGGELTQQTKLAGEKATADIEVNKEKQTAQNQHDIDNPSAGSAVSYLSPDMAEKALPGYGAKMVQDYNQRNPKSPLTLQQGADYISKAHEMFKDQSPDTSKEDNHQDTLEKQAIDRLTQIRGDSSIQRTELQRDAAGQAYNTLAKAESEGRPLNELENTDLLGQLWQARTGKAPTDSDMKAINGGMIKRSLNHAVAYATNDPNIVGATSEATFANLKQFVVATGQKADQQHDSYMAPRLIKPTALEDNRWQSILSTHRGMSYKDQMNVSDKTYKKQSSDLDAKKAALRSKLGI